MVGVTEVSSRPNDVLNFGEVHQLADDVIDHGADLSAEAVGKISDTHVRAADGK